MPNIGSNEYDIYMRVVETNVTEITYIYGAYIAIDYDITARKCLLYVFIIAKKAMILFLEYIYKCTYVYGLSSMFDMCVQVFVCHANDQTE